MKPTRLAVQRLAVALAVIAFTVSGCGGKEKKPDEGADTGPAMDENVMGDSDNGKAMGLVSVNFPYDSFVLDASAKGKLKANAAVMKDKSSLKIQVEGHCDQRGGIQYNLALGEKRANAVRKYLADMGIPNDRVTTISYGKERPLDPAENEEAWAKNRRANFVITSR